MATSRTQREQEEAEKERKRMLEEATKQARIALNKKQFEWAAKWYSDCIELDGTNYKHFQVRSLCYYKSERFELALADGLTVISLRPRNANGYLRAAAAYARLERYASAFLTCVDGLDIDPANTKLHALHADVIDALRSGKYTDPAASALILTFYKDGGLNTIEGDVGRANADDGGYDSSLGFRSPSPTLRTKSNRGGGGGGVGGSTSGGGGGGGEPSAAVARARLDFSLSGAGTSAALMDSTEMIAYKRDGRAFAAMLHDRKANIYDERYDKLPDNSREGYQRLIRGFFDQEPVRSYYFLYYSGRSARSTGDWCVCRPRLSLADIVDMWRISAGNAALSRLVIVADCPYAGLWVDSLRTSPKFSDMRNVAVQAASLGDQMAGATAAGGLFTQTWLGTLTLDLELVPLRLRTSDAANASTSNGGLPSLFASADPNERPVLAISSWRRQVQTFLELDQTPCAFAKWAMPEEVVVHCGRRLNIINVVSARRLEDLHEYDRSLGTLRAPGASAAAALAAAGGDGDAGDDDDPSFGMGASLDAAIDDGGPLPSLSPVVLPRRTKADAWGDDDEDNDDNHCYVS